MHGHRITRCKLQSGFQAAFFTRVSIIPRKVETAVFCKDLLEKLQPLATPARISDNQLDFLDRLPDSLSHRSRERENNG